MVGWLKMRKRGLKVEKTGGKRGGGGGAMLVENLFGDSGVVVGLKWSAVGESSWEN